MAVYNWVVAFPPEIWNSQAKGDGYLTISNIEIKILFFVWSEKECGGCWAKIRLLHCYKKSKKNWEMFQKNQELNYSQFWVNAWISPKLDTLLLLNYLKLGWDISHNYNSRVFRLNPRHVEASFVSLLLKCASSLHYNKL